MSVPCTDKNKVRKPEARIRNPKLRYCIHDRSERQQCAKCNAYNRELAKERK